MEIKKIVLLLIIISSKQLRAFKLLNFIKKKLFIA